MKKLFLTAVAAMFALAAGAQNQAIDELVEKYTDREGFTVVNLNDGAVEGLSAMIPHGEGTITLDDGSKYALSEVLKEIVSVMAVISREADEEFALEMRRATTLKGYSTVASVNGGGLIARVWSKNLKRGKYRGCKEVVVSVLSKDATVLARVIGNIDTDLLARLAAEASKG
jgi:pectate lyase